MRRATGSVRMRRALHFLRGTKGEQAGPVQGVSKDLAWVLAETGRGPEAETLARSVYQAELQHSDNPFRTEETRVVLANALAACERWDEAVSLYRENLAFQRQTYVPENPVLAYTLE